MNHAMSVMTNCGRTMTRSPLSRTSSVSVVLPLPPKPQSSFPNDLRRAQSSFPAIECSHHHPAIDHSSVKLSKVVCQRLGLLGAAETDEEGYGSDCTSCGSSVNDYYDMIDEPQRVSKDILRSLSTSFRWLEVPFQEFDLPPCNEDVSNVTVTETDYKGDAAPAKRLALDSINYVYIYECETGASILNHEELKAAMGSLGTWTIQAPRNCCLGYRHNSSGEVATLPWPDLEAGGAEEIERFVSMVNRMEGKPVFFSRYGRVPYYPTSSFSKLPSSAAMTALVHSLSARLSQELKDCKFQFT